VSNSEDRKAETKELGRQGFNFRPTRCEWSRDEYNSMPLSHHRISMREGLHLGHDDLRERWLGPKISAFRPIHTAGRTVCAEWDIFSL
jgi:hypothetical protein